MAPPLHSIIRKALEAKQVQTEDIETFLKSNKSWSRYESAFKILWGICVFRKMVLEHMTLEQMAGNIVFLNKFSPAQARNAYSALLLLPGWGQLRFSPLLVCCRKNWQTSQARYSTFWDATTVLDKLAHMALDWESIQEVRDRLIIIFRLLNLSRSIDLARTWRCMSQVGEQAFVLTQRKNQNRPQWEAVIKLKEPVALSPLALLMQYVRLTASFVPAGSFLLRQLKPPFAPLCANTIGSITKHWFKKTWTTNCPLGAPFHWRGRGSNVQTNLPNI